MLSLYLFLTLFGEGGGNIDTIQKNTEALLEACHDVGLEVNPKKTKCRVYVDVT
jgi:hypothetical protein